MYIVRRLFHDDRHETIVWITDRAKKDLAKFVKRSGNDGKAFAKKLSECALRGFEKFHGGVIIHEGDGVFRFGIKLSLFRLVGFYKDPQNFLFLEALKKPGHDLSEPNDRCIERVAQARKNRDWEQKYGS